MELSRQRLRPSILETYTTTCSHCNGTGLVRSTESTALHVLRAIETEAIQGTLKEILVTVPSGIDLYLLNQKRTSVLLIENRFDISIQVTRDDSLNSPDFRIDVLLTKDDLAAEAKPTLQNQPRLESPEEVEDDRSSNPASDEESAESRSRRNRNRRQRQRRSAGHNVPHQNQEGNVTETTEQLWKRISEFVSSKEDIKIRSDIENKFFNIMNSGLFYCGGALLWAGMGK